MLRDKEWREFTLANIEPLNDLTKFNSMIFSWLNWGKMIIWDAPLINVVDIKLARFQHLPEIIVGKDENVEVAKVRKTSSLWGINVMAKINEDSPLSNVIK